MVVNHIQNHGQTLAVAGVDQTLEGFRTAVAVLHGKGVNPVITPIAIPGELGHGHEFQRGDPQFPEFLQMGDNGGQRSFR